MLKILSLSTALSGFSAVLLGAFGSHVLKTHLDTDYLAVWNTAVQYQFYHTLALLFCTTLAQKWPRSMPLLISSCSFSIGIILFSGSLYVLCLTSLKGFGAVTPFGGLMFLIAWAALAYTLWTHD